MWVAFFFFFCHEACGISSPMEQTVPPVLEGKVLTLDHQGSPENHWAWLVWFRLAQAAGRTFPTRGQTRAPVLGYGVLTPRPLGSRRLLS